MAGANILLVDDLRHFKPEVLEPVFGPSGDGGGPEGYLRICRTSASAVETLGSDHRTWDQVWLDHDLGMVDGEEDTTMAVVDYILFRHEQGDPIPVLNYIIHSSNTVGVKNIAMALSSIGRNSIIVDAKDFFFVPDEDGDAPREHRTHSAL